jgi:hypothetical protein
LPVTLNESGILDQMGALFSSLFSRMCRQVFHAVDYNKDGKLDVRVAHGAGRGHAADTW